MSGDSLNEEELAAESVGSGAVKVLVFDNMDLRIQLASLAMLSALGYDMNELERDERPGPSPGHLGANLAPADETHGSKSVPGFEIRNTSFSGGWQQFCCGHSA